MADAIGKKNNTQTYLRQISQEKAKYKRELAESQRNDMKAVREYYADQNKQLEQESAAAVLDIKSEARQMAEADREAGHSADRQLPGVPCLVADHGGSGALVPIGGNRSPGDHGLINRD